MKKKIVVCIGAALIDDCFTCFDKTLQGTSNPSSYFRATGGVSCNIAHHLSLLGQNVELISHFGNDTDGKWLLEQCKANGIGITHSIVNNLHTGRYSAILTPEGELFAGAMSGHLENVITTTFLEKKTSLLKTASIIQIDCNLSTDCLKWLIDFSIREKIPCVIEPVSKSKAKRLQQISIQDVLLITPSFEEMEVLNDKTINNNSEKFAEKLLKRGVKNLWVKNGIKGSKVFTADSMIELPAPQIKVVDTTGAGDAALAGWIYAWLLQKNSAECLLYGHSMASIILRVKGAIKNDLTIEILESTVKNYK